ncbi:hypothetical protein ABZP36_031291 [Zizania latifolia]
MGSANVDDAAAATVAAFLERCHPSGDAAYGELKALLGRLHDPAARRSARAFLAALRPFCSGADSLARYGFRIHDLLLHSCGGLPVAVADDESSSASYGTQLLSS